MTANTNPMGFARIIQYENAEGQQRLVCALLPPMPNISPSFAATGISAGGIFTHMNLPNEDQTEAWLMLMNAARCLDREGSHFEEKRADAFRSEEHTSELQSLMRISYAVFCLKKKN